MKMLKSYLLFCLCLLTLSGNAQDYKTSVSAQLNPGLATMFNPFIGFYTNNRLALSGGLTVKQRITAKKIYLETGVLFSDKGSGGKIPFTDVAGNPINEQRYRMHSYFITVPLNIIFHFRKFYAGVGPSFNYGVYQTSKLGSMKLISQKMQSPFNTMFGSQLMLGMEQSLTERIFVNAEVNMANTFGTTRYFNYGLGVGVNYILSK